jgi:hypothetical protein
LARVALGAILFTQAALVAAACQLPERSPAKAILSGGTPPCHAQGEPAPANVNLCVAHCLADLQNLDKASPAVPPTATGPVLIVGLAANVGRLPLQRERAKPAVGPPPRILLHSFLI